MTNIKDKQNKIAVRETDTDISMMKNQSKNSFKLLAEKGQKIVTAIYMITDILSETDPMFILIRDKSVDAMKCLFRNLIEEGDISVLEEAQHNLYELLSYLSIIHRIGNLSKMNYDILFKEIGLLQRSIKREVLNISRSNSDELEELSLPDIFNSSTDDSLVDEVASVDFIKEELAVVKKEDNKEDVNISFTEREQEKEQYNDDSDSDSDSDSDISLDSEEHEMITAREDFLRDSGELFTEDELDLMSFNDNLGFDGENITEENEYIIDDDVSVSEEVEDDDGFFDSGVLDIPLRSSSDEIKNDFDLKRDVKADRHEDILNILESKKDASITDICFFFEDCSSKTIQRDLKELIREGKVTKQGDRRWAKYNLR